MITELGLSLEYDSRHTWTYNLYLQLFGQPPECDCYPIAEYELFTHLSLVEHGKMVEDFFWHRKGRELQKWSEEELKDVDAGLKELRDIFSRQIKLFFTEEDRDLYLDSLYRAAVQENNSLRKELEECRRKLDKMMTETNPCRPLLKEILLRHIGNHPIGVLNLPSRVYNCLVRSEIATVEALLKLSVEELKLVRDVGEKSAQMVRLKLAEHRLCLRDDQQFLFDHYPLAHIALKTRLLLPISRLELPSIVERRLDGIGVRRIGDMIRYRRDELLNYVNSATLRRTQVQNIDLALHRAGLEFRQSQEESPELATLKLTLEDLALPDSLLATLYREGIEDLTQLLGMRKVELIGRLDQDKDDYLQEIETIEQALAEKGLGLFPYDPEVIKLGAF